MCGNDDGTLWKLDILVPMDLWSLNFDGASKNKWEFVREVLIPIYYVLHN